MLEGSETQDVLLDDSDPMCAAEWPLGRPSHLRAGECPGEGWFAHCASLADGLGGFGTSCLGTHGPTVDIASQYSTRYVGGYFQAGDGRLQLGSSRGPAGRSYIHAIKEG